MRGNLKWECNVGEWGRTAFEEDENGYYELVDDKIVPYQKDFTISGDDLEKEYFNPQSKKENSSEQEVDYLITAFKDLVYDAVWKLSDDGKYISEIGRAGYFEFDDLMVWVKKGQGKIWRVGRKSDSQEFSVDEEVEQGKIKEFYVAPYFSFSGWEHRGENTIGVKFYDGGGLPIQLNYITKKKDIQPLPTDEKIFSLNDIILFANRTFATWHEPRVVENLINRITELAKQKLNK